MFAAPDAAVVVTALISMTVAFVKYLPGRGDGAMLSVLAKLEAQLQALKEQVDRLEYHQDQLSHGFMEWLQSQ